MSNNIMIRKARQAYVCDCCGHIIRAGSEYLDKVILNNGKCVQHERYHDECPKVNEQELLFNKLVQSNGDLIVADKLGTKIHIIGIAFKGTGPVILFRDWDSDVKQVMDWSWIYEYHDADGRPVVQFLCLSFDYYSTHCVILRRHSPKESKY